MSEVNSTTMALEARVASLESMRDVHQAQLLELAGVFSMMQDTMNGMVDVVAAQGSIIAMLVDDLETQIGPTQARRMVDELAAKRRR